MEEFKLIYNAIGLWIIIVVIIITLTVIAIIVLRKKGAGAIIIGDRGSASPFWWFLGGRVPGGTGKGWDAFSGGENEGEEPGGGSAGSW